MIHSGCLPQRNVSIYINIFWRLFPTPQGFRPSAGPVPIYSISVFSSSRMRASPGSVRFCAIWSGFLWCCWAIAVRPVHCSGAQLRLEKHLCAFTLSAGRPQPRMLSRYGCKNKAHCNSHTAAAAAAGTERHGAMFERSPCLPRVAPSCVFFAR